MFSPHHVEALVHERQRELLETAERVRRRRSRGGAGTWFTRLRHPVRSRRRAAAAATPASATRPSPPAAGAASWAGHLVRPR